MQSDRGVDKNMILSVSKGKRVCILSFLLLPCIGLPRFAEAKSLQNMEWLRQSNRKAPIYLVVGGRRLDLDADIAQIVAYYQEKPADEFLLPPRENAPVKEPECARDLKSNVYTLRRSDPKVELPADLHLVRESIR